MAVVETKKDGRKLEIIINHPPVNALTFDVYSELTQAFHSVEAMEDINVVIFRGTGRGFSAGLDMKEAVEYTDDTAQKRREALHAVHTAVYDCPLPVICAVQGFAIGGALPLVALSDIRIATRDSFFSYPEIDRGRGAGGWYSIYRLQIPAGIARELLYTGRKMSATEAHGIGLVDHVVERFELDDAVNELAGVIASKSRDILMLDKRTANAQEVTDDWLEAGRISRELSNNTGAYGSPATKAAEAAFFASRGVSIKQ